MIIHYRLTKSLTRTAEELLELIAWQYEVLYIKRQLNPPKELKELNDFYHAYKAKHMLET